MRKLIMAGNWKMYKNRSEAIEFIEAVRDKVPCKDLVETIICCPSILLQSLVKRQGENLRIGAQNMHHLDEGAFTGEISPKMLINSNITYSIIGHSERRRYYNETEKDVNLKVLSALSHGITPIVCIGESKEQFEHSDTDFILCEEVKSALQGVSKEDVSKIVFAYEPIWAVGAKTSAPSDLADLKCGLIRSIVDKYYGKELAEQIRVLYGGSVNQGNLIELISKENIDGALLGRSSLDSESYITMCNMALDYVNKANK
jgi:triosephosphate isomerase